MNKGVIMQLIENHDNKTFSFMPHLTPGDPTRIDDCALLNLPHKVAEVRGEEQHMGHPGQSRG